MPEKDELVLDSSNRDIQRLVTNEGCFANQSLRLVLREDNGNVGNHGTV